MLSDRCLSVLFVTLVYCGQTVGWIKMKLGIQVGLGPGHVVLDGNSVLLPQRGGAELGPYRLWPNGWMDPDATWYRERRPGDFVLDGDPAPLPKKAAGSSPQFSVHVHCGQTA